MKFVNIKFEIRNMYSIISKKKIMNLTTIKEEKNIWQSGVHPVSPAYMFLTITTELRGLCLQEFEAQISRTHGSILNQMSLKKHIPNTVNMNTEKI